MKQFRFIIFCCAVTCFCLFIGHAFAADVTLQWDANTEADIAGYKIYYDKDSFMSYSGSDAEQGESPITVPLAGLSDPGNPRFTLTKLNGYQDHYFAVTAYDSETPSLESGYSNEVMEKRVYIEGPPTDPTNLSRWEKIISWFRDHWPWQKSLRIS